MAFRQRCNAEKANSEPIACVPESEKIVLHDVFCQGTRGIWSVGRDNALQYESISNRVMMDKHGTSSYIHCTCVSKLPQGGRGCFGVFRQKTSNTWHLCVVQSFFYLNHDNDNTDEIHLLEWTGPVTKSGSPAFYSAGNWDELRLHFSERVFNLDEVQFCFVNKVRGNTFSSLPIADATRSTTDGGIQCNPGGPDIAPDIGVPVHRDANGNVNLSTLERELEGIQPFFQTNNSKAASLRRNREKRKRIASSTSSTPPQSPLSTAWSQPPPRLPQRESKQLSIIVSNLDGGALSQEDTKTLGDADGLLFFPSPECSEVSTHHQEFFGVSHDKYHVVMEEINGVSPCAARQVLQNYASTRHTLCNATSLFQNDMCEHSYTKIFLAGEVSPPIDPSPNSTIQLSTINRSISYKIVSSSIEDEYIPVSVGIVDPCLHGIKVTKGIIERIILALGKNGLFTRRPRSAHKGSLSFIGRRAYDTVAQPNPSEGDIKSFWYYRQHINQAYWLIVLKVINYLTNKLLIFPQVHFIHLAKILPFLFPLVFQHGDRDFCLFAILTVNFVNCVHVDEKDDLGQDVDSDVTEALRSLLLCKYLTSSHKLQIKSSLDLIEKYGTSSPTTCGYQCISPDDVQIVQYFSCYGIGVCHQIRNFWTHSFLASTFSHYTSAPLFIHDGLVYSEYAASYMLGWGKGKDRGSYYTMINDQHVRRSRRLDNP